MKIEIDTNNISNNEIRALMSILNGIIDIEAPKDRVRVSHCDLRVRTINILRDMGMIYIDELVGVYPNTFLKQRNAGKRSLDDITTLLESHGLSWKTNKEYD